MHRVTRSQKNYKKIGNSRFPQNEEEMTVLSEFAKTSKKIDDMDGEADDQEPTFSDPEGYEDSASDEGFTE